VELARCHGRVRIFALAAVLTVVACTGDAEVARSAAPSRAASATTSALVIAPATTAPPAPAIVPSATPTASPAPHGLDSCGAASDPLAPAGAICVSVARGDVDGDGIPDRAVIWGDGASAPQTPGQDPWRLLVATASRVWETQVVTPYYAAALRGIIDVNADGRGLILVSVDHGASTEFWVAYALVGEKLAQVVRDDGGLFVLPMFGSVMHGNRFECVVDTGGARLLSVMGFGGRIAAGDVVYDWSVTNYRLRPPTVSAVGTAQGTVTRAEMEDPVSAFNRTWPTPFQTAGRPGQCGLRLS
jgi:hypothetical protein